MFHVHTEATMVAQRKRGLDLSRRGLTAYRFGYRLAVEAPDIVQAMLDAGDDLTGFMQPEEQTARDHLLPATWWAQVRRGYRDGIADEMQQGGPA